MWQKIGILVVVCIGSLLIIALVVQGSFSLLSRRIRAKIAPLTDRRVQLMSELIAGIQVSSGYLISHLTYIQTNKIGEKKDVNIQVSSSTKEQSCAVYEMINFASGDKVVRLGEAVQQDRVGDQKVGDQQD